MTANYIFYHAVTIACVCYTGNGPPPKGTYLYNTTSFPFYTTCAKPAIIDPDRESHKRPARYFSVELSDCVPKHKVPFTWPLNELGIKPFTSLSVQIAPSAPVISPESFVGLSPFIADLTLSAVGDAVVPEPGTLAGLTSVREVILKRVRPDRLPPNITGLSTEEAGYEVLPAEALSVNHLTVNETQLTSLSGTFPHLKIMILQAPLTELPLSQSVEEVQLIGTAATLMPAYTSMRKLEMTQHLVIELQNEFLRGCGSLTHLKLVKSHFTKLPADFFHYTRELLEIDLSDNDFRYVPSVQMVNLPKLETLKMNRNQLHYIRFDPPPQAPLRTLELSDNPIREICANLSNIHVLKSLTTLNLTRTGTWQVCTEWLRELPHLKLLDLSYNHLNRLTCGLLRTPRALADSVVEIDFTGNRLVGSCGSDDYSRVLQLPKHMQLQVRARGHLEVECSCSAYWLVRVLRDFGAQITPSAQVERCYTDMAAPCRVRTGCRFSVKKQRCDAKTFSGDSDVFEVDGKDFIIQHDGSNYFRASCAAIDLEDIAFPGFPWNIRFHNVSLHGCRPPNKLYKYYSEALNALNVIVGENFFLYDLPSNTTFKDLAFYALPSLQLLHLEAASKTEVLVIRDDILPIIDPISELHLVRVRTGKVSTMLTHLNLTDTGMTELPKGVDSALNLTIIEKNLNSVFGISYRMQQLSVTAPVTSLINATRLLVLELIEAKPPAGFIRKYPHLKTLKLQRLLLSSVPTGFLSGGAQLRHFEMTHNLFNSLPADLFSFSKKLESINLNDNKLDHLPKDLFTGLNDLELLNLDNNRLAFSDLPDLRSFVALKNYSTYGNVS